MITPQVPKFDFKPRVLVYFCNSCHGLDSSHQGLALTEISNSITSVHFKCAREVTPAQIRHGFANGADGILLCGCLVRDCDNSPGDLEVLRSLYRNQIALKKLGLASDRLREEWVVQGTTDHLERIIMDFVAHLAIMGPVRPPAAETYIADHVSEQKEGQV